MRISWIQICTQVSHVAQWVWYLSDNYHKQMTFAGMVVLFHLFDVLNVQLEASTPYERKVTKFEFYCSSSGLIT